MNTDPRNNQRAGTSWSGMARVARMMAVATTLGAVAGVAVSSHATSSPEPMVIEHVDTSFSFHGEMAATAATLPFTMVDVPLGEPQAPSAAPRPVLAGASIASFTEGLLVADADSGKLIRLATDAQTVVAELTLAPGLSQVVVHPDGGRAYVVNRAHDEIVVVDLSAGLDRVDALRTRAEPYGISLTPSGDTLMVTTVADKNLTALDLNTGLERWSLEVGPEPRGVAVAPDGREALVTFLTTGAVARIPLGSDARPRASYISLDPGVRAPGTTADPVSDEGKSFARNAFVAGYVGHGLSVVPHQLSTPHLGTGEFENESSGYGGGNGFTAPVSHRLAFLSTPERGASSGTRVGMATTSLHQPRALAYDAARDRLYVAGFGSDSVMAVASVSQSAPAAQWTMQLERGCGPTGVAVIERTGEVAVWCSLTRKVVSLDRSDTDASTAQKTHESAVLAKSQLSAPQRRGRALFRSGDNHQLSAGGAMACSSCHAEVRADGLSWRLQGHNLQTPLLAGRLEGAHPFKWDGKDATLHSSLTNTVQRLGGSGITAQQALELADYLNTVPAPRKPTVASVEAVRRGEALFASDATGCATCHSGPLMTDQQTYDLSTDLGEVDTPSLVGLATSAPYYHDGSAATLTALLRGNANVHGMGRISKLSDSEIGDLVDYLKTL